MSTTIIENRRGVRACEIREAAQSMCAPTPDLTVFMEGRGLLFAIGYRILGSAAEAEDVVQEVWLRWQLCDRSSVREPMAYLATAATRAAINVRQSARVRRETSIAPQLTSLADATDDPILHSEQDEALERAIYLLLERLSPAERAAYVLRVGFDYPYPQLAVLTDTTQPAARQLVSRARKHLEIAKKRDVDRTSLRRLVRAFRNAAREGDVTALETVLTQPSDQA